MLNHKEINRKLESILGHPKLYDVRCEFKIVIDNLLLEEAEDYLKTVPNDNKNLYSITSCLPENYCDDLNLALLAAKKISEKNNQTFVLSLEDGEWKAAYGDWRDCAEYKGANPAYVTCMAIIKYMGKA